MGNLLNTYQLIADILSFKSDQSLLESKLKNGNIDWDSLVKVGSSHLVLPSIYSRLKSKKLLNNIPNDLKDYLKEIAELNRKRNLAIIDQAKNLAQLFEDHNIDYVFLKGVALLLRDQYNDIAERMIGDIDLLILEEDLERAFALLKSQSYDPSEQTLGNRFFEHKHLPRLTTGKYVAAVELHKKLFISYKHEELTNENILNNRVKYRNIYTPSYRHLLLHNILNYQINDYGKLYKGLNFRTSFDTLVLNNNYQTDITNSEFNDKWIKSYFYLLNNFFVDFMSITPKRSGKLYIYQLKNGWSHSLWIKFIKTYKLTKDLATRFVLFLTNTEYRSAIWNDRTRVWNLLKTKIFQYPKP